ncbi:MAG: hypothetical protein ACYC4Q_02790 [Victivallaceae bacterium]
MIRFVCINCGQKFKTADEYAGQASQCPGCGTIVQIPIPEQDAAVQDIPVPVQNAPPVKQNILNFRPVFEKIESEPVQDVKVFEPAPSAPKLKLRSSVPSEASPAPVAEDVLRSVISTPAVPPPEASPKLKMPGLVVPQAAVKPPPLPASAMPKQAFPVGFNQAKAKLPPGLTLVEEE